MEYKLYFLLIFIIVVVFIELNNGVTTKETPSSIDKKKLSIQTKPMIVGGHTPWETKIKPNHQKIFDDYKKIILKKLQQIHKVSNSFVLKPDKTATQVVGGINYLYLIKLPTNKYAFISIHYRAWNKSHYGKEENVQIRTQTYELNDKNV